MFKKLLVLMVAVFGLVNIAKADDNKFTVYYFHGNTRCMTCNKMEKFTSETINENFSENKNLEFKAVNTDEPENKHFLKDYSLYTKSVVIKDELGNWKNLDKIWSLAKDEEGFKNYIKTEINTFMVKK